METSTTHVTVESTARSSNTGPTVNVGFVATIPGILLIVGIVLSLIVVICAGVGYFYAGSGFCVFFSLLTLGATAIIFVLHLLTLMHKLPGPWGLILFIYYVVTAVLFFIVAVLLALYASWLRFVYKGPPNGAGAFFAFVVVIVYGVLSFLQFRSYQSLGPNAHQASQGGGRPAASSGGGQQSVPPQSGEVYDPTMYGGGAPAPNYTAEY